MVFTAAVMEGEIVSEPSARIVAAILEAKWFSFSSADNGAALTGAADGGSVNTRRSGLSVGKGDPELQAQLFQLRFDGRGKVDALSSHLSLRVAASAARQPSASVAG